MDIESKEGINLREQIEIVKNDLRPHAQIRDGLLQFTKLLEMFVEYIEKKAPND